MSASTVVRALVPLAICVFLLTSDGWGAAGDASSLQIQRAAPTLARLCFHVPPAQRAAFEAVYREQVVPLLRGHGLVESSERGRATPDSVISRLFEVKTLPEVAEKQEALWRDAALEEVLRSAGAGLLWAWESGSLKRLKFEVYTVPAGPGTVVPAGPGRTVPAGHGKGHWRTYGVTDGLADVNVLSILQDQEGVLWFGTGSGVSRYDGQTWTTFTAQDGLASNKVRSGLQDRGGILWFGTSDGVSRYDGQTWTTFTTKNGLANSYVQSIFQDREGHLWFGTYGGGVSRYDGRTWTTFTTKDGLVNNIVRSVFQDREGYLWFGTEGGVCRYSPSTRPGTSLGQTWTTFTTKDGLLDNRVGGIFQDREGHLWFATEGGGVSRYDGKRFTTFTTQDGLANNFVNSVFQDREGHLWFGTGGGACRYDERALITFTSKDGLAHEVVLSIFEDREGHLWFGTFGGGVSLYDREGRRSGESSGAGQGDDPVNRPGWGTFTTFTTQDGLAHNHVRSIFQDRGGNLWFSTRGGVSRYDGKTFTTFTAQDGLTNDAVRPAYQDRKGHLWFGPEGGGVIRYDPAAGSGDAGRVWMLFTAEDGLIPHYSVFSIFEDRAGYLWFGTQRGGVSRYDREGRQSSGLSGVGTFTTFTTKDGLANNTVRSIFQDQEGYLWFGTYGGGVSRYDGQIFETLTREDGLAHNQVLSILQDRDGYLWFGTLGGVTRFRPPTSIPPLAFVDAALADRRYERVSHLTIPSSEKLVAFEFHGISLKTRPEQMVYRYRLKGYEEEWRNTRERRVEYQNLPRGTYTFEVVAVDRDLVYSETPAAVALTVHLPYERIGWLSALGLALALVAWQAGRVVRRDLKLRESEERLRTVVTGAPVVLWAVDRNGVFTFSQGRGLDALGLQPGEAVGQSVFDRYRDAPQILGNVRRALAGESFGDVVEVAGRVFDARYSPIRDEGGEVVGVIGVATDVTERIRAEEERVRLDEQLQHMRYLYRLRSALRTVRSSEEVIRQAGESIVEVLSVSVSGGVLIEHQGRAWRFGDPPLLSPRGRGEDVSLPVHGEGRGGGQVFYERPLVWGERERGRLVLFSGVELSESQERALLDETAGQIGRALEALELEAQLLQSARLVSLGQMAAGVAHELNQPLTALSATAGDIYLRLVENLRLPPEQLKEMMQDVLDLIRRMSGTVDHMRVFSRDTAQEPGVLFSVNEVIRSGLHLIEAQLKSHDIQVRLDLSEALPPVSGSPHQMEQVFLNLMGNARDAVDEKALTPRPPLPQAGEGEGESRGGGGGVSGGWGKRVWVRTRCEIDGRVWVIAEVEDNGVGIDEAHIGRVFEPFFTTKPADRGTGLGLSISYAIVRNHDGQIACESRKGEGTVFRVRLPAAEDEKH